MEDQVNEEKKVRDQEDALKANQDNKFKEFKKKERQ